MKQFLFNQVWTFSALVAALLLVSTVGCAPKNPLVNQRTVTAVTNARSETGVIYLKANGFAKKPREAEQEAVRNAVSTVIFQGVPNSNVQRPLVSQSGARQAYREFFDAFFAEKGPYLDYAVVMSESVRDRVKIKRGVQRSIMLKVNYTQLQRMLEQQGIIKRFGI